MVRQMKKKFEFIKIAYILNMIIVVAVIATSFIVLIKSGELGITDLSFLTVLCPAAFAELSVFSVCYARKAQAENVIKISKTIQDEQINTDTLRIANEISGGNNSDYV